MYRHAATEAMSPHLTKDEMVMRRVLHSLARAAEEIARETSITPSPGTAGLREAACPEPGHAMARLLLVTAFGGVDLDFADIKVTPGDTVRVTATDRAGTWTGTADGFDGAILAMLADRCGYHADITRKADWGR
jgi:hypothetical protein